MIDSIVIDPRLWMISNTDTILIDQTKEFFVNLFPNPSSDIFKISCSNEIQELQVYNLQGQLVDTFKGGALLVEINLANYADGEYLCTVVTAKEEQTVRLRKIP